MRIEELRKKNIKDIHNEMLRLLREQFNLRIQSSSRQLQQTHLLKQIRCNIARIKTVLTEKKGFYND